MASQKIGSVKAPQSGRTYEVKWNSSDQSVYVSYAGWTKVGRAGTAGQAMNAAEAFLHNK